MSLRQWLGKSIREAASLKSRSDRSSAADRLGVPEPAESQVVLRDDSTTSTTPTIARVPREVEYVEKLPPEVLSTTHDVAYDWDYAVKRAELRTLYEKSKDLNWNARTDLDWSIDVDPEREIVADAFNPIFGTDVWRRLD